MAPDKETIYYSYVVDDRRKLLGFVSLKDLIVARREARVGDIMHPEVIFPGSRMTRKTLPAKFGNTTYAPCR